MHTSRRDFVVGLGGAALGAAGGAGLARGTRQKDPIGAPETGTSDPVRRAPSFPGQMSYAQSGEDMIVSFLFGHLKIADQSYLDIGAYEPVLISNTFLFYERGHRGVLVEPNVTMCEKLKAVRPRDITLNAGIGVAAAKVADYYVMSEPSWSTFDKAEAEHQVKVTGGTIFIKEVRKLPLLDVNDVIAEHFKGAPSFVSIDAEGWHFAILKAIDYTRFRPKVICVETLVSGENTTIPEIPRFMETQGYVARGGSFANAIFVDSQIL
jgi:FkbM family methyltransferase